MLSEGCKDQQLPPPPKFLQIKQDDKFLSKLSPKDQNSKGEASFRVLYYGGASGTVPFMWESRPGTPKHTSFKETSLPPLTPPPSYLSTPKMNSSVKKNPIPKPKILPFIFPRISFRESNHEAASLSSSSVSSSSKSSSFSLPSTPRNLYGGRNGHRRSRSVVHFGLYDDEDEMPPAPTSSTCFGGRAYRSSSGKFSMYRPMKNVKKAILCIIGSNGTA